MPVCPHSHQTAVPGRHRLCFASNSEDRYGLRRGDCGELGMDPGKRRALAGRGVFCTGTDEESGRSIESRAYLPSGG